MFSFVRRQVTTPVVGALLGLSVVVLFGLGAESFRTDYTDEALPAVRHLVAGEFGAFFDRLPGYGGAVLLQAPFAVVGSVLSGGDAVWTWRAQAIPGLVLFGLLGVLAGTAVLNAARRRGLRHPAWAGGITAALVTGTPFALLAQQNGHPEELLVVGLVALAGWVASRRRVLLAAGLVGIAAVAKPWALIAVPVVLAMAPDLRTGLRATAVCAVAGVVLLAPMALTTGPVKATGSAHTSTAGIFRPNNVFWFSGKPNPAWPSAAVTELGRPVVAPWGQRTENLTAARVSHPAIVLGAGALAGLFLLGRLRGGARPEDALLLLAAVGWWRCLLDTWNVDYYMLGALTCLTLWEARRGTLPWRATAVTLAAWVSWKSFRAYGLDPDVQTVLYLAWTLPVGVLLTWRAVAPTSAARVIAPVRRVWERERRRGVAARAGATA